ncbi:hypothetical protein BDN71DRAFT_1389239, partial [Pleurotus eryngii]
CFDERLFCKASIVEQHGSNPFHQIENWNSLFFEHCMLQSLGFQLQLGHPIGGTCTNPVRAFRNSFVVITSHGVIPVTLNFCSCMGHSTHNIQLLWARLFSAMFTDPCTATTFEALHLFQLLSFSSKISAYEFYNTLSRLMNNLGNPIPVRHYACQMIYLLTFAFRILMKCFGHGHDPGGVASTRKGECTVLCPVCPHPGKNLPPNWKQHRDSKKWIHTLFLAINTNFHLKQLSTSNDVCDPSFNSGSSYFVEEGEYKALLEQEDDRNSQEVSTCNNYDAVKLASIHRGKGTTANGVGTIKCSQHNMKHAGFVSNLQKGENYCNMDYLYFSSIKNHLPKSVVVLYDITCQWSTNLAWHSATYPLELVSCSNKLSVRYLVPKFTSTPIVRNARSTILKTPLSVTNRESPEQGWAAINPIVSSTKEMGPGLHPDTLDDHFRDYNWHKVTMLHKIIIYHYVQEGSRSCQDVCQPCGNFLTFSASLPAVSVQAFSKMVHDWEMELSKENPYVVTTEAIYANKVRLQMAQEKEAVITAVNAPSIHSTIMLRIFIEQGLELIDQQTCLQDDAHHLGPHSTEIQQMHISKWHSRLLHRIVAWNGIQELYLPGVTLYKQATSANNPSESEYSMLLPSDLLPAFHVDNKLADYEWCLCFGQAYGILADLHCQLLILSTMYQSKDWLIRGQSHNTGSATLIHNVQLCINFLMAKY